MSSFFLVMFKIIEIKCRLFSKCKMNMTVEEYWYQNDRTSGYEEYCYESTVEILKKKFKHSNVLIVCPVRMHKETYSCFDHFIPPSMSTKHGAVRTCKLFSSNKWNLTCILKKEKCILDASDGKAIEHLMCLLHSCQHSTNPLTLEQLAYPKVI